VTGPAGLSEAEARVRLAASGPNEIDRARPTPVWRLFARQFKGALIWLLLGAAALSGVLGEVREAVAIAAALCLNAIVGLIQERGAERAVFSLRALTAPRARVRRDGRDAVLPAAEIVPGDLLVLEAGDVVAADATLSEAHDLHLAEAVLTGESLPVEKAAGDKVFMGTAVARGVGLAEVAATGMKTELGRIARLSDRPRLEDTPLQNRLEGVARRLAILCGIGAVIVGGAALAYGLRWIDVLLTAVSLAVALVPEALAPVITIALAAGVRRLATRHVLVRRLSAVETLGSTTVICSDKTGTLTTGVMAARKVWGKDEREVLDVAAACCDAELPSAGDPTELALLLAARERGIERAAIESSRPRSSVVPFDASRKYMAVARSDGVLYLKGAVEVVLARCAAVPDGAREAALAMADEGLRVLALAKGRGTAAEGLELAGFVGIADPPRPEAVAAVAAARKAGIKTVMITGDHPRTANAIARELGILREGDDPAAFVHARATPEDKLRIVEEWQKNGEVVAMTGDGVNDLPALKAAHVGVAMGKGGTEVAREGADVVLTDDNYASIVAGVAEGRGITGNIQKTLVYLLSSNTGELLVMLAAAILGMPLPLLPLQLLWVNLVTDAAPALALVLDPTPPGALDKPPRPVDEPLLGRREWARIGIIGAMEGALAFGAFAWALQHGDLGDARDLCVSVVVFAKVLRSFAARSRTRTYWETGFFSNPALVGVALFTVTLQLFVHYLPFTRELLGFGEMPWNWRWVALAVGLVPFTVVELSKLVRRHAT
jgi:Ca2+-transporting ATPase